MLIRENDGTKAFERLGYKKDVDQYNVSFIKEIDDESFVQIDFNLASKSVKIFTVEDGEEVHTSLTIDEALAIYLEAACVFNMEAR
jgi:hypothetical protein